MFRINVVLNVNQAEDIDTVKKLLSQAAALSREEKGCERFEVYHSESDPATFLLCEWWASEQDWKDHRNEKAFQEIYQPQVMPKVTRTPHITGWFDG